MNKKDILQKLNAAKDAHIGWRIHAQCVINGLTVEDRVPVFHTDCAFGKWYYGDGQILRASCPEFSEIEVPHEHLHQTYIKIHQLLFDANNEPKTLSHRSGLRIFDENAIAKARIHLQELVGISDALLKHIVRLEGQVKAL